MTPNDVHSSNLEPLELELKCSDSEPQEFEWEHDETFFAHDALRE